jgi:hypothetical protein
MKNTTTITLTSAEVETLLIVLGAAYASALETSAERTRDSGEQIGANEPVTALSGEDDSPVEPIAEVIKRIEQKVMDTYLE